MPNRTKQERLHYFAERWLERFSEEKFDYNAFNYFKEGSFHDQLRSESL